MHMIRKINYRVLCLLFLFGAQLLSASGGAEGDSTKGKYPITDPRNPNCPCHKYQAQADREYAKLLQKSGQEGALAVKGESFEGAKKLAKARQRRWSWGPARSHKPRVQKKKCFKDRLSRCFHF